MVRVCRHSGGNFRPWRRLGGRLAPPKNPAGGAADVSSGIPLNNTLSHGLYLAQAAAPDYGITENTDYLQFTNPEDGQNLNPAPGTNAIPTDQQQFNLDYGANTNPTDELQFNPDYGANTNPDDALELNPGNGLETTQEEGQNINPNIWDETAITGNQAEKTNPR